MSSRTTLPDLLQQTREVCGDAFVYRFANGLTIKTDVFMKADRQMILPLGRPQGALMNHMLNFPGTVAHKRVFEPFAGSGALGFMALQAGAAHVDFLDINPRASDFQRENAAANQFPESTPSELAATGNQPERFAEETQAAGPCRFRAITGDIATFAPEEKYDLIVANPPFVPTPEGIDGSLTSNGGADGSRFVQILLKRLEEFLEPSGQALIYVFQFAKGDQPLIVDDLTRTLKNRPIEVTPCQARPISFETYCKAYALLFPTAGEAIDRWRSDMILRHGNALSLCHYIVDIGPQSQDSTSCVIRENFAEKFGETFLTSEVDDEELAMARVWENVVPEKAV